MIPAVAVIEARGPCVVKAILGVELGEVGIAIGIIKRFIEGVLRSTFTAWPVFRSKIVPRVKGRCSRGANRRVTVARSPNQVRKGGDKAAFCFTEIAPVIFILIFPINRRQICAFDGAGDVDAAVPPPKLVGCRGNRTGEPPLRTFGDDVNQPAGVENTVQRRAGPFRLPPVSVAALKPRGRTVRRPLVAIEPSRLAPKPRRVPASWVPPRVLVCTTLAIVIQRPVERGGVLIFENPIADGKPTTWWNIQQRHRGQRRGRGAERLIAAGGALLAPSATTVMVSSGVVATFAALFSAAINPGEAKRSEKRPPLCNEVKATWG